MSLSESTRQESLAKIREMVWGGWTAPAQSGFVLFDEYLEVEDVSPSDRQWLEARLAEEWTRKREAEKTWPEKVEYDRLHAAYARMWDKNMVAIHLAGYTMSDGISDVSEEWHIGGGAKSGLVGYCFYHGQDLERAVENGDLYLAFGSLGDPSTEERVLAAGRIVADALTQEGLPFQWDGTTKQRILVRFGQWRKRSPED